MRVDEETDFFVLFLIFSQSESVDKTRKHVVAANVPTPDTMNSVSMSLAKDSPQIKDVEETHVITSNVKERRQKIHTDSVVIESEAYLPPYAGKRILT